MKLPRAELLQIESAPLEGTDLYITGAGDERRHYLLESHIGSGQTGVAWKAQDRLGRNWAIKFVLRKDYANHSLYIEAARLARLSTSFLARIDFYGEPNF